MAREGQLDTAWACRVSQLYSYCEFSKRVHASFRCMVYTTVGKSLAAARTKEHARIARNDQSTLTLLLLANASFPSCVCTCACSEQIEQLAYLSTVCDLCVWRI